MPITDEQLATILSKVKTMQDDKAAADSASANRNAADTEVTTASSVLDQKKAVATQAKLDEANADAVATSDLRDLTTYLESLVGATPPPTPPPPTPDNLSRRK